MSSTNTNPSSNTHSGMLFPSSTWPAFTFKDECTEAYIKKCEGEGSSRDTLDIDKAYEICQEIVSGYRYNNNALQVTQVIVPPPPTTEQFMSVAKCEHIRVGAPTLQRVYSPEGSHVGSSNGGALDYPELSLADRVFPKHPTDTRSIFVELTGTLSLSYETFVNQVQAATGLPREQAEALIVVGGVAIIAGAVYVSPWALAILAM